MAEPVRLVAVDENYQLPVDVDELTPAERAAAKRQAFIANGIKEGRRRASVAHEAAVTALTGAHLQELARVRTAAEAHATAISAAHGRGSFYQGALISGAFFAVLAACGTFLAMSSGMFVFGATQRAVAAPAYDPPPLTVRDATLDPVRRCSPTEGPCPREHEPASAR